MRSADLFLDTLPYGAHTTASDALWMGVPVLTVPGRGFASRVCASLVQAAGLADFVCADAAGLRRARHRPRPRPRRRWRPARARLLAGPRHGAAVRHAGAWCATWRACSAHMWAGLRARAACRSRTSTNLDAYLELGAAMDHEGAEISFLPDWRLAGARAGARRHAYAPLPPDGRCWPLSGGGLRPAMALDIAAPPGQHLRRPAAGTPAAGASKARRRAGSHRRLPGLAAPPTRPRRSASRPGSTWACAGAAGGRAAAMIAYRQALALKPDLTRPRSTSAWRWRREGRAEEALGTWRSALQPDAARTALLNHRGRLLEGAQGLRGGRARAAAPAC